jgi:hypothetical protein
VAAALARARRRGDRTQVRQLRQRLGSLSSVDPQDQYTEAVPLLRDLLDRPDTPLNPDVKKHIHRQLDLAEQRFTAILAA